MSTNPDRNEEQIEAKRKEPRRFSRRSLLKAAAALAGAVGLGSGRPLELLSASPPTATTSDQVSVAEGESIQVLEFTEQAGGEEFKQKLIEEFKGGRPRFIPESVRAASTQHQTFLPTVEQGVNEPEARVELQPLVDAVRDIYTQHEGDAQAQMVEVLLEHFDQNGQPTPIGDINQLTSDENRLLIDLDATIRQAQVLMNAVKTLARDRGYSAQELALAHPKKIHFLLYPAARSNVRSEGNGTTGDVEELFVELGINGPPPRDAVAELTHWLFPYAPSPARENQLNQLSSPYTLLQCETTSDILDIGLLRDQMRLYSSPHGVSAAEGNIALQTALSVLSIKDNYGIFRDMLQEDYGYALYEIIKDNVPFVRDRTDLFTISQNPELAHQYADLFVYLRLLNLPAFGNYVYSGAPDDSHSRINEWVARSPYEWLKNLDRLLKGSGWIQDVTALDRANMQKGSLTVMHRVRRISDVNTNSVLLDIFSYRLREDLRLRNLPSFETQRQHQELTLGSNMRVLANVTTNQGQQWVDITTGCNLYCVTDDPDGSWFVVTPANYTGSATIPPQRLDTIQIVMGLINPLSAYQNTIINKTVKVDFLADRAS